MYLVFIHMPGECYCRQLGSSCVFVTSFKHELTPSFVDSAQALWAFPPISDCDTLASIVLHTAKFLCI